MNIRDPVEGDLEDDLGVLGPHKFERDFLGVSNFHEARERCMVQPSPAIVTMWGLVANNGTMEQSRYIKTKLIKLEYAALQQ